ncbi:MAG: ABC transporter permease [Anaerolineae bacterium]|nr:ABC transporter permease [Anaerolineae bacterium]
MNTQMTSSQRLTGVGVALASVVVSLVLTAIIVLAVGASPGDVFARLVEGMGFSDAGFNVIRFSGVVNFWIPLFFVSIGLLVTFTAGLWNIGVEGQMAIGAVFATWVAQEITLPTVAQVPLEMLAAGIGGALWAMFTGMLKTRGGVHEIFGGVAMNNLANIFSIYLISGPWGNQGGQATPPFRPETLLQPMHGEFRVSLVALVLVVLAFVLVFVLLSGTRWGLELRALGKSQRSALLLGVPVERNMVLAMAFCGFMAGLAGSIRVLFTYGNLRPLVSGGIGFLGLLVVLLADTRAMWVPFISIFFAAILAGSTRLKIAMQLDQSLSGVVQGILVLVFILANGVRGRMRGEQLSHAPEPVAEPLQEAAADGE